MSSVAAASPPAERTSFRVLGAISLCHFLNDMMQSLIPALYPILKTTLSLDFAQIGAITLTNQVTASLFQPVIGSITDKRPQPFSLAAGMTVTLAGLLLLAQASTYSIVLVAVALVGFGSAIFHPESSRVARLASGGRYGMAQSLFQVGGNAGSAVGPVLAALIVVPRGQGSIAWFASAALLGIGILARVGLWYRAHRKRQVTHHGANFVLLQRRALGVIALLLVLIFSKYFYLASLTSYYTFYLMHKFGVSVRTSQILLFVFLGAVAAGTFIGGPVGDRIGRKRVIQVSILGVLPFSLVLPHVGLTATVLLSVPIGVILASAFSAIVVYAQELLPGNVGMISGLFFGFAFGIAGVGAAVLGALADWKGIEYVYLVCSCLPALGLLAAWLPDHAAPASRL